MCDAIKVGLALVSIWAAAVVFVSWFVDFLHKRADKKARAEFALIIDEHERRVRDEKMRTAYKSAPMTRNEKQFLSGDEWSDD